MYRCVEKYRHIRGFNFQPDWGCHGITLWLKFDAARYRKLIRTGKENFPHLNTLRIWLSFDAWCEDRQAFLRNAETAGRIITEEGLSLIPVYFNGWFGLPSFGGFAPETLGWVKEGSDTDYHRFIRESAERLSSARVLLHDVSNEPFNNINGSRSALLRVTGFLSEMASVLRRTDSRPVTVGSQGFDVISDHEGRISDLEVLSPLVDVFSLHPYNIPPESRKQHYDKVNALLAQVEPYNKPALVTECCWAGVTDEERIPFLETELPHYAALGLGFCCHAMSVSPVADLHPLEDGNAIGLGLYMAFLDRDGHVRKGHEIFNSL